MLVRKAKNQYLWKGFAAIPQALHDLQVFIFLQHFLSAFVSRNLRMTMVFDISASWSNPSLISHRIIMFQLVLDLLLFAVLFFSIVCWNLS